MVAQDNNLTRENSAVNVTDDREACPRFWIAAYTRPKSEKKASTELANNPNYDIKTYVATQTLIKKWSDRKKKVISVVIPMIVFVNVRSNKDILAVKQHPLILKILTLPGEKQPAHIPEDQIINLKLMLSKAETPVEFIKPGFNPTDTVRVVKGNLTGLIGKVERINEGKTKLIVSIDMLGGAMVEINTDDLEIYHL